MTNIGAAQVSSDLNRRRVTRQLPQEAGCGRYKPFGQRTPLPLQCEVVELGLLVYSVAMSGVWLCTYQGCSTTVWSDDDGGEEEEEEEVEEEDD